MPNTFDRLPYFPAWLVLLGVPIAIGPLSIDMYLPIDSRQDGSARPLATLMALCGLSAWLAHWWLVRSTVVIDRK